MQENREKNMQLSQLISVKTYSNGLVFLVEKKLKNTKKDSLKLAMAFLQYPAEGQCLTLFQYGRYWTLE